MGSIILLKFIDISRLITKTSTAILRMPPAIGQACVDIIVMIVDLHMSCNVLAYL